jgi:hypothetical protein
VATIAGTFSAAGVFFDRASNLADLRLPTLWRQTMRLAQIIIFLVGALAAVGLLMESMASYGGGRSVAVRVADDAGHAGRPGNR